MQVEDEILEPDEPEPTPTPSPDRLTRKQVAERLGVSLSKVRTMEGKELHPTRENGVNYFAVAEIDALARTDAPPMKTKGGLTDGQLAASEGERVPKS